MRSASKPALSVGVPSFPAAGVSVKLLLPAAGVSLGVAGLLVISPVAYLAATGGFVVTALILLRPSIGFALTVATIPLEAAGDLGNLLPFIKVTPAKLFALVTMAAFIVHLFQRRERLVWTREMTALTVFLGLSALSVLLSTDRTAGYQALVRLSSTWAYYVLAANMMPDAAAVRRSVILLSLASTLTFGFAVAQRFIPSMSFGMRAGWEESDQRFGVEQQTVDAGESGYIGRSSGTSVHSIVLAVNTAIIFAALVALCRTRGSLAVRGLFTVCALISLAAAATSFSRTGFIVYLVLGLGLIFSAVIRVTPLKVGAAALAIVIGIALAPASFIDRVLSPTSYTVSGSESLQIRSGLWRAGFKIVGDNPLIGMGLGNTKVLGQYWDYPLNSQYMTVHNAYLQVAMEVGIPGLVCLLVFFWLTFAAFGRGIQHLRREAPADAVLAAGLMCGVLALLVAGTALDFMNQTFKNAWLFIAAAVVYDRIRPGQPSSESPL